MLSACIWEYLSNHVKVPTLRGPCPARNEHVRFIKKNKNEMSTQRGVCSCFLFVCVVHMCLFPGKIKRTPYPQIKVNAINGKALIILNSLYRRLDS